MAEIDWGEPGPMWLQEAETYGEAVDDWGLITRSRWSFVTHVPHSRDYMHRLRDLGIRAFPYMTFYQAPIHQRFQGYRLSEHPEWIEIDARRQWKHTGFWESEDSKNWYCTCTNVKGFTDRVLEYLDGLMDMGASGIFLDNLHPNRQCHGPHHGAHEHLFPTQIEAFADLLRRARKLIRSRDPEGALLVNSADPTTLPAAFWPHVDAEMSESYICTWVADRRWGSWEEDWNSLDEKLPGLLPAGKQVCCLSYLGHTPYSLEEDAFFAYASARLMGFIWTAGGAILSGNPAEVLYRLRLGPPAGPKQAAGALRFRLFRAGLVAVNPTGEEQELHAEVPCDAVHDVYLRRTVDVGEGGSLRVLLPPQSGRVYLWASRAADTPAGGAHRLLIRTRPALGKVEFQVDGIPLTTHAGRWTTEYVKGPLYGQVRMEFDEPGKHVVELLDAEVGQMRVAENYEQAYRLEDGDMPGAVDADRGAADSPEPQRLGRLMDPAQPTRFLPSGQTYRFTGWSGAACSRRRRIEIHVEGTVELTAGFALHGS